MFMQICHANKVHIRVHAKDMHKPCQIFGVREIRKLVYMYIDIRPRKNRKKGLMKIRQIIIYKETEKLVNLAK